jgi:hypothetical protein
MQWCCRNYLECKSRDQVQNLKYDLTSAMTSKEGIKKWSNGERYVVTR